MARRLNEAMQPHQIRNREQLTALRTRVSAVPATTMAYLAGYYDGEGCLTVNGRRRTQHGRSRSRVPYVCIKIGSADRDVLDQFAQVFGGSVYEAVRLSPTGRVIYNYRAGLNVTRAILESLLPYLVLKREQSVLALEMFNQSDTLTWKEFLPEKLVLIERIRAFNHKGKSLRIQVNK